MTHFILASASLGRKRLLDYLIIPFEIVPSKLDEDKIIGKNPIETIKLRAKLKGEDVLKKVQSSQPKADRSMAKTNQKIINLATRRYTLDARRYIILSADSDAIFDNKLYSKPKNYRQAYNTLQALSGRTHEFTTAVYIIKFEKASRSRPGLEHAALNNSIPSDRPDVLLDDTVRSFVTFRILTDEDIKLYLKLTEYTRFAGAYALSSAQNFITNINGSISNVIGLPLESVIPVLQKEGVIPRR